MSTNSRTEPIYNLFLIGDESHITHVGVQVHEADGNDADKIAVLRNSVNEDLVSAQRFPLKTPRLWDEHRKSERGNRELELFEQVLTHVNASATPLTVITPIVNGSPRIEAFRRLGGNSGDQIPLGSGDTLIQIDWLSKYSKGHGIDLPMLFEDDYFKAIRLLHNAKHLVSAGKLLLSFIDTAAFLDMGDVEGNFAQWLKKYADLSEVGVSPEELWEFRNSLLHMTNSSSRAVRKGRVAPLIIFTGGPIGLKRQGANGEKYFNFRVLLEAVAAAVGNWISTYNSEPDKFVTFVERYDLVVSDSRTFTILNSDPTSGESFTGGDES
jgi:hypothetical protein